MPAGFLDSSVLIYAFTKDDRRWQARALLQTGPAISVQGLNEFANVARRKLGMSWMDLREAIASIRLFCPTILPINVATHDEALSVAKRYGYAMYDALIVASALQANSETLWSEDMQHGMMIGGRLRIANPFRKEG
jgi:predicted nucleic acid-binding protein